MIRLIGYWKASLADHYPFPQELETEHDPEVRDHVVRYLEAAPLLVGYRGLSWCRFGCPSPNGSRELFDGAWAWPEGLAHYVREHSVALPREFVDYTIRQKQPPRTAGDPDQRLNELDDSYWIEWAHPYRTPAVEALLEEARAATARAYAAQLDARTAELTAQLGVSETACDWAGCDRRALAGKAICAAHAVENQYSWLRAQVEFEELRSLLRKL